MKIDAVRFPVSEQNSHDVDGFPVGETQWGEQIPCTLTGVTRAGQVLALKSGYQAQWDCHINAAAYAGEGRAILVSEDREYGIARSYLDGADMILTLSLNDTEV